MKLGIVGSRTFGDYELLKETLAPFLHYYKIKFLPLDCFVIISGGARGADSLAERYIKDYGLECFIFRPDWNKHGKAAGYIRNQQIVDESDVIVAFWDGESKGTKDTIDKARRAKKPTFIIYF